MLGLFAAFGLLLALATQKVPLLSISATAPLFAWIALEASASRAVRIPAGWLGLAGLFWLALLGSLTANVVGGDVGNVGAKELALLVRFGFWIAVFVVTAGVTARARWTPRLAAWLAAAAALLALMRIGDALLPGRPWLDQNEYGLRFSAFLPFLLAACLQRGGLLGAATLAVAGAALLANGSRSSWVALTAASCCLLALRAFAGRGLGRPALALASAVLLLTAAFWASPRGWTQPVERRMASMTSLETDKPFRTRLALVHKGVELFAERPLFGAGLGRFDVERVELPTSETPWTNRAVLNQRSSHNAYLSLLAETGLAGTLSFVVLLGALLARGAWAAYRLLRRGEAWAGGVWASALAVSLHLWTLSGLTGTLPWFVFGLMAGVIERSRQGGTA